jgi:hypothetical protein
LRTGGGADRRWAASSGILPALVRAAIASCFLLVLERVLFLILLLPSVWLTKNSDLKKGAKILKDTSEENSPPPGILINWNSHRIAARCFNEVPGTSTRCGKMGRLLVHFR